MPASTPALRQARRAWRLLHADAPLCLDTATRALKRAQLEGDGLGEAWARLVVGFHRLYFADPAAARAELDAAAAGFAREGDRAGEILAIAGQARARWRSGEADAAMALLLPLRDEGLALLRDEQRAVLLNAIAGCYSAQRDSERAFAYMYEALRGAGPKRGHGFDAALHCNLSHELMELGDHEQALAQIELGLARCAGLANARLEAVLRINRVVVLTEQGRAEATAEDIERLLALDHAPSGRGTRTLHYETLALAALKAGRIGQGRELLARAAPLEPAMLGDERLELAVARALLQAAEGNTAAALRTLQATLAPAGPAVGAGLRAQALVAQELSLLHEQLGDSAAALAQLRRWQALNAERSCLASRGRYQAAALQTELLSLQHRLEESSVRQRATERARAELVLANRALSRKIEEVQALQAALREQATHDALTGLANRRHLNDTLPGLLALALRERAPLTVVVVDLDHFKRINDDHGHPVGDRLLASFGRLLREQLRASDLAFRYGGEEFCLLMPHTTAAAAAAKLQGLLQAWQAQRHEHDGGVLPGQSFSAGVADSSTGPPTPQALLTAADHALLAAKRLGRARICLATPAPASGATGSPRRARAESA
jgi:diguanylate cyclase (GGDEF)-like protein